MIPIVVNAQGSSDHKAAHTQSMSVFESLEGSWDGPGEQPAIQFGMVRAPELTISVDDAVRYQTIDGFGASLTDSSAWLLEEKLSEKQRNKLLQQRFDPIHGIGLSLLRQPMGSSDFALEDYTYDDLPEGQTDPELRKFSIEKDQRYIIPLLKKALELNPHLKILASPWSPPGWMKSSQSMLQGSLLPSAYQAYASYFVRFVEAYRKAGVPIFAVTPQNEPLNIPVDYPGMGMNSEEQSSFIRDDLGPAFRESRLKTRIFIFDHNWDLIHYPVEVLNDPKAASYVSGIAIHCYGGNPSAQTELHERFPKLDIWLTECSGGDWQTGSLLGQQMRLIINATRNWSHSVILWNLALDQDHKPFLGGCKTCRGLVTIKFDDPNPEIVPTIDFTAIAQVSKFLRPGARRIESNTFGPGSLEDVAFRNSDGSIVLVALNSSAKPIPFNIRWSGMFATYTLKAGSAVTFVWQGHTGH